MSRLKPAFFALPICIICFLICVIRGYASEESLTITTYYPSPYGSYRELRSQRIAIGDNYINGATYSWDNGTINANADLVVEGNVGIGTTNPGAKLEVAGQIKITGGSPGVNKVLISGADGLASWGGTASGGLYVCPNKVTCNDGQAVSGVWASYGCLGHISFISYCTHFWWNGGLRTCSNACTYLGKVLVN